MHELVTLNSKKLRASYFYPNLNSKEAYYLKEVNIANIRALLAMDGAIYQQEANVDSMAG